MAAVKEDSKRPVEILWTFRAKPVERPTTNHYFLLVRSGTGQLPVVHDSFVGPFA
jgi:hypothetical protein